MKKMIYLVVCFLGALGCSPQTGGSTIDQPTQQLVDSLLTEAINRYDASGGVVMVLEVATGKVIAQSTFERDDSATLVVNKSLLTTPVEQGSLFFPVSMLFALNEGFASPDDSVDTGYGRSEVSNVVIVDRNRAKGGFGVITASQAVALSSNIGIAKIIFSGFGSNPAKFYKLIRTIGWDSLPAMNDYGAMLYMNDDLHKRTDYLSMNSIGYALKVSPVGMLSFYNAIANNGTMVLPQNENSETVVLNPSIASAKSVVMLRSMLEQSVMSGSGAPIRSDVVSIAAIPGTVMLADNKNEYGNTEYMVSTCGYFPAQTPKFTCIVTLFKPKNGFPSGSTMAGSIMKSIAENITVKNNDN